MKIYKNGELLKETPETEVNESYVFETKFDSSTARSINWKLLDIFDDQGAGLLPKNVLSEYFSQI